MYNMDHYSTHALRYDLGLLSSVDSNTNTNNDVENNQAYVYFHFVAKSSLSLIFAQDAIIYTVGIDYATYA